jgi:hypothetical protein
VMKAGTTLVAPSSVARATCGLGTGFCGLLCPGLVPPTAGCAWHCAQPLPSASPRRGVASGRPEGYWQLVDAKKCLHTAHTHVWALSESVLRSLQNTIKIAARENFSRARTGLFQN